MDFKNLIVTSWHNTLNFIGPLLLVTLVQLILIIVSFGILAPVTTAGYVHSLMRAVQEDRKPEVGDLFSQMRLFLPLFIFSLLAVIAFLIGFTLLVLPGFAVMALVAFAAFYLIPLMTEQRLGLFDGLKMSWDKALQAPVSDHIIVVIIYLVIMSLGSSLPFAFLITQPLATFILVGAYRERVLGLEAGGGAEPDVERDTSSDATDANDIIEHTDKTADPEAPSSDIAEQDDVSDETASDKGPPS
jgi:hypothetical protein